MSAHHTKGYLALFETLTKEAREEFRNAYLHDKWCQKHDPHSYAARRARSALNVAKKFFYGDAFVSVSPVVGDEYVKYLVQLIEEEKYDKYFSQPEELDV